MSGSDSFISRRNFLKTGTTTVAGLALASSEMIEASGIDLKASKAQKLSDEISTNRVVLGNNLVNGVNTLDQEMINSANTTYVIQSDYFLRTDIKIPPNCFLDFEGGSISGNTVTGVILNDVIKPEWFGAKNDGTTDSSEAVQNALNVCKAGSTVLFSQGSYAVKHCEVRRDCEIVGWGATLVGQKYQSGANSFDYIFISDGNDYVSFIGFRLTGIGQSTETSINTINNPLLYVNNAKVAKFESLFFDNVHTYKPSIWEHAYYHKGDSTECLDAVSLLGSIDVNKTIINNCEFTNCWYGEWTWISFKEKERADVELVYSNNYIHDYNIGNTPINAYVGNLIISNNTWENATYTGSLVNCHGYKTTIRDNVFKNCIASSVFDTCEYGQVYCDQVYIENNYVDCLNALVVLTTARVVIIKDNVFNALAAVQTYPYIEYETSPELRDTMPTNKLVLITGNDINCNKYDVTVPQIAFSGQRSGIFAGECYCKGDTLIIRDNHIVCAFDSNLVPSLNYNHQRSVIRISNMDNVVIEGNYIQNLTPMSTSNYYMNIALIEQQKSVKVPYDDSYLTIGNISVVNNLLDTEVPSKIKVLQIRTDHRYLDVKCATHDMEDVGFYTDENVGIRRLKSPIAHEYESAYETDCENVVVIPTMSKGEIKTCDKNALLATSDTAMANFDSIVNKGVSVRRNRIISFGNRNWQNLFSIKVLNHIPKLATDICKVGEIALVDGKAWRRCPDIKDAVINLNNIKV